MNTPTAAPAPSTQSAQRIVTSVMDNAQALVALASAAGQSETIGRSYHLVVPKDYVHKDITALVEAAELTPARKQGTVTLKSVDSLLVLLKDQAAQGTGYVYADPDACTITAVLNDHRAAEPGWRDHRAVFKAEFTPEFMLWKAHNKQPKEQAAFAEFIEDNLADITAPAAQALLDVATTIQAKTDITFSSARRLQNGQTQLAYTETIDARAGANGALEIPKEFDLGLRIFKNGDGYKLRARLKYRLASGGVKFWYELDRPERAIEDAFHGYVEKLIAQSGYAVLLGAP